MKSLFYCIISAIMLMAALSCNSKKHAAGAPDGFVRVDSAGQFRIGDSVYNYVGTNFWYGAILGSEGRGGDRERLARELDTLASLGITNLRVLVGGDGEENRPSHIMPVLQTAPGVYNDTLLDGLDYFMAELEKRGMKAVLYLNNSWEWSGGYGAYLEWAGAGKALIPAIDGYKNYTRYVSQFVLNDSAKAMAARHIRFIVGRTNRYTGRPYTESPALMSWQIANEPRPFENDSIHKEAFAKWISETAALIKSLDPNHLVSTGSEGLVGCEGDIALWERIHRDPNIDYGIIHLWPYNWGWVDSTTLISGLDTACVKARAYIEPHAAIMKAARKPFVLEEFGYPRDGMALAPGTPTEGRDAFYKFVFSLIRENGMIAGCNFWGWGGLAQPGHTTWQPWEPYTGDPAQEPQGLYSVFAADTTTLRIISDMSKAMTAKTLLQE